MRMQKKTYIENRIYIITGTMHAVYRIRSKYSENFIHTFCGIVGVPFGGPEEPDSNEVTCKRCKDSLYSRGLYHTRTRTEEEDPNIKYLFCIPEEGSLGRSSDLCHTIKEVEEFILRCAEVDRKTQTQGAMPEVFRIDLRKLDGVPFDIEIKHKVKFI